MQSTYFIDNSFNREIATKYRLSIRYATDGFSFCVHNFSDKLIAFAHFPCNFENEKSLVNRVKQILADDSILNLQYERVEFISTTKDKTLVPKALFSETSLEYLFKISQGEFSGKTLSYSYISTIDSYLVESIPEHLYRIIKAKYSNIRVTNSAYYLLVNSLTRTPFTNDSMSIDIHELYFDIVISKRSELILFNSYSYQSIIDIVYYITNCVKQSGVDMKSLQIAITGNHTDNHKFYALLNQYLINFSIISDKNLNALTKNISLNSSYFLSLLNIHKCE